MLEVNELSARCFFKVLASAASHRGRDGLRSVAAHRPAKCKSSASRSPKTQHNAVPEIKLDIPTGRQRRCLNLGPRPSPPSHACPASPKHSASVPVSASTPFREPRSNLLPSQSIFLAKEALGNAPMSTVRGNILFGRSYITIKNRGAQSTVCTCDSCLPNQFSILISERVDLAPFLSRLEFAHHRTAL